MSYIELAIKIDEDTYNNFVRNEYSRVDVIAMHTALVNGAHIPDNATNGDVIKAMFPNMKVDVGGGVIRADRYTQFDLGWWNSPYQKVMTND